MKTKVGILGGAFNPPHRAHLLLADDALENLGLDKLIFVPTNIPPHKEIEGDWDSQTRSLMIKIASYFIHPEELMSTFIADESKKSEWESFLESYIAKYPIRHHESILVSDLEVHNPETSYTIHTVKTFLRENPDWEIYIIIGMDQAAVLDTWEKWEELSHIARFCAADRGDMPRENIAKKYHFIQFFDFPKMDISSSDIREKLKNGEDISELVPDIINEFLKVL
jgi:nicotinate-nucleotide adenylyltransferase